MNYTVNKLAKLSGVSVRTLHYYDEIGLLKPSFTKENGYRVYQQPEVLRLQQILFFRELEFSLEQIKEIMNSPHFDQKEALREQRKLLKLKQQRIEGLVTTIDKTIKSIEGGESMNTNDLFGDVTKQQMEEYKEEARQRWGHTEAYKQSIERTKNWTKEDYDRVKKEGEDLLKKIVQEKEAGKQATSPEVQALIAEHFNALRNFYEPSFEMYKGLGEMYVADSRFTQYYEKFSPNLAKFMRDGMVAFANQHLAKK